MSPANSLAVQVSIRGSRGHSDSRSTRARNALKILNRCFSDRAPGRAAVQHQRRQQAQRDPREADAVLSSDEKPGSGLGAIDHLSAVVKAENATVDPDLPSA